MSDRQVESSNDQLYQQPEERFYVFTGPHSQGNPALVRKVDQLPDLKSHLKQITAEQANTDLTYVYISHVENETFSIRWFNHQSAIQRCGHGTIAAAAFLSQGVKKGKQQYHFISAQEALTVELNSPYYSIKLPIAELHVVESTLSLSKTIKALKRAAQTITEDGYIIVELQDEHAIKQFKLTKKQIQLLGKRALIITANSHLPNYDIVFRYFAPQYGQTEDIATGSAATVLWPFWQQENTTPPEKTLRCLQLSKQGGELQITQKNGNNVIVSGEVTAFPDRAR